MGNNGNYTNDDVSRALRRKAAKLYEAAGNLRAAGRIAEANADELEADNCRGRAQAIDTNQAFNFPSDQELQALQQACDELDAAIRNSADVNALAAAAAKVRQTLPAAKT